MRGNLVLVGQGGGKGSNGRRNTRRHTGLLVVSDKTLDSSNPKAGDGIVFQTTWLVQEGRDMERRRSRRAGRN
jgi:hypothetical protein